MQLGGLPLGTGSHPLGWCALHLERAVGWHLIVPQKFFYHADVFPKACNADNIWEPECIAKRVNFAFCRAFIFPVNAALAPFLPLMSRKSFPAVARFPVNNLRLQFVYYRHFCLYFQSHVLLQTTLTEASSAFSQRNVVEHVKSLLVLSIGAMCISYEG